MLQRRFSGRSSPFHICFISASSGSKALRLRAFGGLWIENLDADSDAGPRPRPLALLAILALAGVEDDAVRHLDERFGKMLTAHKIRVWESGAGDPFWDFGYPRNAGDDLMEDLRAEGLIKG